MDWKIWQKFEVFVLKKKLEIEMFSDLINVGPLNKAVGPGKKFKINKRRTYVYSAV